MSKSGATNPGTNTGLSEQAELLEHGFPPKPAPADSDKPPERADPAALDDFFRPMNRKLDLLLGRPTGYPV